MTSISPLAVAADSATPATIQFATAATPAAARPTPQQNSSGHGLPDDLRAGLEQLGKTDLSSIRVHYNSPLPERIGAHAFTQSPNIHIAPRQEAHLPHEGWHAVQQLSGRVSPTTAVAGIPVNDDVTLERESDAMGSKALQVGQSTEPTAPLLHRPTNNSGGSDPTSAVQRVISLKGQKQFNSIDHLRQALKELYAEDHHHQIDTLIDDAHAEDCTYRAVNVFKQITGIGSTEGWSQTARPSTSSNHGPQLPRLNASHTAEDPQSAMSSFMMGSVTLGRIDLILPDKEKVSFEARQSGPSEHAEDVMIEAITQFQNSHPEVKLEHCSLRITINNLPCHKGKKEKDCSQKLSNFMNLKGFKKFHIYYVNNYGENPVASINNMQEAGIDITIFAPRNALSEEAREKLSQSTKKKVMEKQPVRPDIDLDSYSESEPEPEPEQQPSRAKKQGSGKRKTADSGRSASQDEESHRNKCSKTDASQNDLPGRRQNVSGVGLNCLIRALLVAAGMEENDERVRQLREQLVDMQVAENGQMLDLATAAGAILISQIAPDRGVVVYTPEGPHNLVAGNNPVNLWLSDQHFEAIT